MKIRGDSIMDDKIRRYRAKHRRCRNCKHAIDTTRYYIESWRCSVTGMYYHNHILDECRFKGMLCKYYEPREDQEG